jgi:hypothetical protein
VGTLSVEGGEWVRSILGEACLKTVSTAGLPIRAYSGQKSRERAASSFSTEQILHSTSHLASQPPSLIDNLPKPRREPCLPLHVSKKRTVPTTTPRRACGPLHLGLASFRCTITSLRPSDKTPAPSPLQKIAPQHPSVRPTLATTPAASYFADAQLFVCLEHSSSRIPTPHTALVTTLPPRSTQPLLAPLQPLN